MSGRIVMGFWDCPYCGTRKIQGTYKDCPHCDTPRDYSVEFYMDEVIYLDEEEAKLKGKGADWHCAYCDSLESVLNSTCQHCGATREESSKNYFQIQEKKRQKEAKERAEKYTSSRREQDSEYEVVDNNYFDSSIDYVSEERDNFNSSYESHQSSYGSDDRYEVKQYNYEKSNIFSNIVSFLSSHIGSILFGLLGIATIVGFIWLLIPKPKTIEVTQISWENNIRIESYETVDESGWSVPSGGRIQYTKDEIHHYDSVFSHYETKTRTYTVQEFSHYDTEYYYSNNGDGTFTEHTRQTPVYKTVTKTETYQDPVYEQVPVYQTKYYYEIDKWIYKRSVETSGIGRDLYWGEVILDDNERENGRNTNYYILGFETKDKEKEIKQYSASEEIWKLLNAGDIVKIKVTLGTIVEIVDE